MKKSTSDLTTNQPRLKEIIKLALNKKADKIIILDVRGLSSLADFFIICHGTSEPQVKAIADHIRKRTNHKPRHIEGYDNQNWILLDYFDIIVHVFKKDEREYYNLERLWADPPYEEIDNERN